jgi:hypothetical protein
MRAFFAASTGFERDEIAARQLHALREHLPRGTKLRLVDVHEMFEAMKDHACGLQERRERRHRKSRSVAIGALRFRRHKPRNERPSLRFGFTK